MATRSARPAAFLPRVRARLRTRIAASTCSRVGRCGLRAVSSPRRQRSSSFSRSSSSALPARSRSEIRSVPKSQKADDPSARGSADTSVDTCADRSAAWRSARFSRNCMIVTNARRHGASQEGPHAGNKRAKVLVLKDRPRTSRHVRYGCPLGKAHGPPSGFFRHRPPAGEGASANGHPSVRGWRRDSYRSLSMHSPLPRRTTPAQKHSADLFFATKIIYVVV